MVEQEATPNHREQRRQKGEAIRCPNLKTPIDTRDDKSQINFTYPHSRIMKAGNGNHVKQAYNAQSAVDIEGSYLIVRQRITDNSNEKQELVPGVASAPENIRDVRAVPADTGYFSEKAVGTVEADKGETACVAMEKTSHHRTVSDLVVKADPPSPDKNASMAEIRRHCLKT